MNPLFYYWKLLALAALLGAFCSPVYAQDVPLTVIDEDVPLAEIEPADAGQSGEVVPDVAVVAVPVETQNEWTKSLMFEDESAAALLSLRRSFIMRKQAEVAPSTSADPNAPPVINLDDLGRVLTGAEPPEIPEEVLQLTLNSIVYNNPNDWTMWVNGQLYSHKAAREGFSVDRSDIKVVGALRDRITYEWTPISESFDKVKARWEDKKRLKGLMVNTQVAYHDHVVFDETAKTVTITLRPNQTFVSQFMSVMEGKDAIRAATARAAAQDAAAESPAESEVQPVPAAVVDPAASTASIPQAAPSQSHQDSMAYGAAPIANPADDAPLQPIVDETGFDDSAIFNEGHHH